MKTPIRITEQQLHNIIINTVNRTLKEAFMPTFSTAMLSQISSFSQQVKYCTEQLGQPVGNGSSRTVFQIDDKRVLKLAKNQKGLDQNEVEGEDDWYKSNYSIFPKVFGKDKYYRWLISEYVLPANKEDFQHCFGITFEQWLEVIKKFNEWHRNTMLVRSKLSDRYVQQLVEENENIGEIEDFIANYTSFKTADLKAIQNYGLAMRDGDPWIVILDSGLSDEVYNQHYRRGVAQIKR